VLGTKQWLMRFSEFTGAAWPAFPNDISHLSYTPPAMDVNSGKLRIIEFDCWRMRTGKSVHQSCESGVIAEILLRLAQKHAR
jgi:hypothetical protein